MMSTTPPNLTEVHDDLTGSAVRRALDVIGDRSTLLILLGTFSGIDRFEQWQRQHSMSRSVLSSRLTRLTENGLLVRAPPQQGSVAVRYTLSEKGRALFSWALAVWGWEHEWIHRDGGHPIQIRHSSCGQLCVPALGCAHCRKALTGNDIAYQRAPGFRATGGTEPKTRRSSVAPSTGDDGSYIGRIVDIVGDRWSFLILGAAFLNVRRFDDFLSCLKIAPNILSDRLKRFVESGLFARDCYAIKPKRYEYILTQKSFALLPIQVTMGQWADQWLADSAGPSHLRRHKPCDSLLHIVTMCSACGKDLSMDNVEFETAPEPA